jgi:hypothetical protein
MIKAKATGENETLVFLALEEENIKKLREGKPMLIRGSDLDIDHDICIFYGRNQAAVFEELKKFGVINDITEYSYPDQKRH